MGAWGWGGGDGGEGRFTLTIAEEVLLEEAHKVNYSSANS